MGRPTSDLDEYLDWQKRLENYKVSGLEVDVFCLQEGVSRFGVGLAGAFLLFWVNGAVGIIGNEGQPANLMIERRFSEQC